MCIFVGLQDGNGIITFEEFITLIDGLETVEKNDKEARDAFNAFDFTGQGFIPSLDIKVHLLDVIECDHFTVEMVEDLRIARIGKERENYNPTLKVTTQSNQDRNEFVKKSYKGCCFCGAL